LVEAPFIRPRHCANAAQDRFVSLYAIQTNLSSACDRAGFA